MRELNFEEVSQISGAGLTGAFNFGIAAGWTGLILGGKYGGSNGGILGFGLLGNIVGFAAGGLLGAAGGIAIGLANDDAVGNAYADKAIDFITSGAILGQGNV